MSQEIKTICDICGVNNIEHPRATMSVRPLVIIQEADMFIHTHSIVREKGDDVHVCNLCIEKFDKEIRKAIFRVNGQPNVFSNHDVKTILGGEFPDTGFNWPCVAYWKFEDGAFNPYDNGGELLPAASIAVSTSVVQIVPGRPL